MRLTTVILIASLMQVSASTFGQRITLNLPDASVKAVLKEIRKQSGYDIFYDNRIILNNQRVSVAVTDVTLEEALNNVFKGLALKYDIDGKTVSITRKEKPTFLENLITRINAVDIRGKVIGENNEILAGATIKIKGTNKTARCNEKGEFFLADVDENAVLIISYIGYISSEVSLKDAVMPLEIKLSTVISDLKEVAISTGYQRIKPTQVTGATNTISTKEYESRISTDFLSGLVNKMPGLVINPDVKFTSSTYNVTSKNGMFNIRGISTITGNQNPLIVLDGYPTELSLSDINPNEIGSVTILKDAAAAAIYGVRAANGVIVIQRKQANLGNTRFAFRSTVSMKPKEDYSGYRWAPTDTYSNYAKLLAPTSASSQASYYQYGIGINPVMAIIFQRDAGTITQSQMEQQLLELNSYNNTEDYERLFTRNAFAHQYNMNISGGTDKALYYFTGNYLGNELNQKNNSNRQLQLSGRTTFNFTKKLSLELTTEYLDRSAKSAPVPDINQFYPFERFEDANNNPVSTYTGSNTNEVHNNNQKALGYLDNKYYPLVDMNEIETNTHTIDNRITANFKYVLGSGFNLGIGSVYERSVTNQRYLASSNSSVVRQYINKYANAGTNPLTLNIPIGGYLQETDSRLTSFTARAQLDYNKRIGSNHSINAIAGFELRRLVNQSSSAPFFGYNDQTLISQPVDYNKVVTYNSGAFLLNPSLTYAQLFSQQYTDDRFVSGYFNMVYAFMDRYSVTGSIRMDQSNLFGQDPKYRYKPLWSIGAAWNIDKENFMQNLDWITSLKLRIAEGLSGNIAKTSLPQIVAAAAINQLTTPPSSALNLLTPANSGLRWEKTNNFNVGVDYSFLSRINGSIDYYIKTSEDLLGNTQIDATRGVASALINQASVRNKGIEFNLNADWMSSANFNWNTGFSLARNTSKVLDIYQSASYSSGSSPVLLNQMAAGYIKGYPLGQLFSLRSAGLDNAGVPLVYDANGNAVRLNTNINPGLNYFTDQGSYIPKYNCGLSNRVDIGNFYFYAMVNFYSGFNVRVPYPTPGVVRPITGAENFWQKPGDELNPNAVMGTGTGILAVNYLYVTPYLDSYTVNGAYLTLGDLTASYNLASTKFIKNLGFNTFEVKLQATNVYTTGFNRYNWSQATGSFTKNYLTPTYTIGIFTNF